jgi:hypothetical protein
VFLAEVGGAFYGRGEKTKLRVGRPSPLSQAVVLPTERDIAGIGLLRVCDGDLLSTQDTAD